MRPEMDMRSQQEQAGSETSSSPGSAASAHYDICYECPNGKHGAAPCLERAVTKG